jgi:hypothetical protein
MGEDPQDQKAKQREALTVAGLADVFLAEHVGAKRKAGTKISHDGVIRSWVLPADNSGARSALQVPKWPENNDRL